MPNTVSRMVADILGLGRLIMETIWDWMTVFAFAGLVTLMLNRSSEEVPRDNLLQYLPAVGGCAFINYLGNEGMVLFAILSSIVTLAYVVMVLKPQMPWGRKSE